MTMEEYTPFKFNDEYDLDNPERLNMLFNQDPDQRTSI